MKKILSMILALAMVMSLFCAVPVNAADTEFTLPYVSYDFNDIQDNATSNYGDSIGSWNSMTYTEGIGGGKALYKEGPGTSGTDYLTFTVKNHTPAFMATGDNKISFWLKLNTEISKFASDTNPSRLMLYYLANGGSNGWKTFAFSAQTADLNTGEWVYYEHTFTWDGMSHNGYNMLTNPSNVSLVMQFRLGMENGAAPSSVLDPVKNKYAIAIDDFRIEPVRTPLTEPPVDAHPYPYVTDYDMVERNTTTTATPIEGKPVHINYTAATAAAGDSVSTVVTRVMIESEAGSNKYGTYATIIDDDASGLEEYTIPKGFAGRKIKISVQPFSANGAVGAHYEKVIGTIAKEFEVEMTVGAYDPMTSSITTTYSLLNNKIDGSDVRAIMFAMFYAEDGTMVQCEQNPIVVTNGSEVPDGTFEATYTSLDANLPAPTTAKVFFWYTADGEEPTVFNTTMEEIYPMQEVSLQ